MRSFATSIHMHGNVLKDYPDDVGVRIQDVERVIHRVDMYVSCGECAALLANDGLALDTHMGWHARTAPVFK